MGNVLNLTVVQIYLDRFCYIFIKKRSHGVGNTIKGRGS